MTRCRSSSRTRSNAHTNDPERTRGRITDMSLADDGLYVTAEVSPRGQRVLRREPLPGCQRPDR